MEKIIGVYLDEVLAETIDGVLKFHNYQINGIEAHKKDITDYYIFNIDKFKISKEDAIKYFRVFIDEAQKSEDILPVQGAKQGLKRLKKNGRKIIIVTARREEIKDFTIHRLNEHFQGLRDEVVFASHFTANEINKSELCKQHGINIMIEDNLDYAIELANAGVKMYLIDRPWNKGFDPKMNKGITKFYDWSELELWSFGA